MKHLLTLMLIFPVVCIGQKKGDNTVIIKDSTISLALVKRELIKKGFLIDKSDSNYITTEFISPKDWYAMRFSAFKEADSIILKSWFKEIKRGINDLEAKPANFSNSNGIESKITFKALVSFAKGLSENAYSLKQ